MIQNQPSLCSIRHAAELLGIHPQTLRLYERQGLVHPARTKGNTRRYSAQDIERLRLILHLTRTLGVNLAGVEIILNMQRKLAKLEREIEDLQHILVNHRRHRDRHQRKQYALIKASSRMLIKVS